MTDYSTNVSFSVPTLQRPKVNIESRPKVDVQPIDISGIVESFNRSKEKKIAAEENQKYNAMLSQYASELDAIQVGMSQGQYDENTADILRRSVSEKYRTQGITFDDDIKVRKNYGEAVPGIAKQTLESRAKEEEKVKADRRAEARQMFSSLKNADNETLDNMFYLSDNLAQTRKYHQSVLANPYSSAAAKAGAKQALNNNVMQEAAMNAQNIINSYMEDVVNSNQVDLEFKTNLINNLTSNMIARGMDSAMARTAAESMYNTSGVADFESLNKYDRDQATIEYKNRAENFKQSINASGYENFYSITKDNPAYAAAMSAPRGVQDNLPASFWQGFADKIAVYTGKTQPNGQVSEKTLKFGNMNDFRNIVSSTDIILRSSNATDRQKNIAGSLAAEASTSYAETQIDPANISKNDTINLNNIGNRLDTPETRALIDKGKKSKDPVVVQAAYDYEKKLDTFKAKKYEINFRYNIGNIANNLLTDNANRLRVDKTGNLVVTGDRSNWQAITDFFTGDTKRIINDVNKGAANMSVKDRIRMYESMKIKPLQPGEASVDPTSVKDVFTSEKGMKEVTTIPLEYETIGGASLVTNDTPEHNSAKVLREYAQRAQESLDSAIASGATFEKGSITKTKKMIKDALKMADSLENFDSAVVSYKSTIGGATMADDLNQAREAMNIEKEISDNTEGNPNKVDYRTEENYRKKMEVLYNQMEDLRRADKFDTNEYDRLSTQYARLARLLGEGDEDTK